ncbi:MAG: hypothetical protein ACRD3S_23020 [Terracidiphilus sp.]
MHFRPRQFAAFMILISAAWFAAPLLHAQTDAEKADKLVRLLKADGYDYKTTNSPTVFVIHFTGTNLKDIKVVMAVGGDEDSDLVVFVTVASKATMPTTADFRYNLLKFNHEYDQVKVGFDGDDDLSVRIDGSIRLMDADFLKIIVTQMKTASDEIYGKIQPSLVH